MTEVERMVNFYDEEAVIYETKDGKAVVVFDDLIRNFDNVECAINRLYKAGFIF